MHARIHAPLHDLPTWLRWIIFGLTLLAVAEAAAAAAAAPATQPAAESRIYKFTSARKLGVNGRDHLVVIATAPAGGASARLVVPNAELDRYSPEKEIAEAFNGMQAGGYFQAETKKVNGALEIQAVTPYAPRPGEDTPHGYIYISSSGTNKPGELKIAFTKLGDWIYPIVPAEKDDQGSPAPNRLVAAEMKQVHEGDVVWADVTPGKQPTLSAIAPWSEPQQGKLTRVGPADVDGQRGFEVEIATESKPVTALIPLKLQNGKRVTDQRLLAAAHKPGNGSEVFFRTFEEGGNTWLLEIEPPPKHPSPSVAQQQHRNESPPPAGIPTHTVGGAGHVPGIGGIPGGF
jgi:hypothetical protein